MAATLSATTQILQAFCKQELFGEVTELIQFLVDLDDDDCPIKFVDNTEADKLELEYEKLALEEPNEYVDYDAYVKWEEQVEELNDKIEAAQKKASARLVGVNEWWACTKRLGEKLKEHGQVVFFHNDIAFWGREYFGYDLAYDKVIKDIASDIEILPGQSHDWSKHIEIKK